MFSQNIRLTKAGVRVFDSVGFATAKSWHIRLLIQVFHNSRMIVWKLSRSTVEKPEPAHIELIEKKRKDNQGTGFPLPSVCFTIPSILLYFLDYSFKTPRKISLPPIGGFVSQLVVGLNKDLGNTGSNYVRSFFAISLMADNCYNQFLILIVV